MKNAELLPEKIRKYVKQHDLHRTVTSVLNEMLEKMPEDPFGHLVEVFAQRAVEPPCFEAVRCTPLLCGDFNLECVIKIRGMSIRPHEGLVKKELFEITPELTEEDECAVGGHALVPVLDAHEFVDIQLTKAISQCSFEDAMKLHTLVSRAVAQKKRLVRPEGLVVAIVGHLLQAAANASNKAPLGFFQDVLARKQLAHSPQLLSTADSAVWATRWPRWVRPVLAGGGPSPVKHARIAVAAPLLGAAGVGTAPIVGAEGLPPLNAVALATEACDAIREQVLKADVYKKAPPECVAEGLFCEPLESGVKSVSKAALGVIADSEGVLLAGGTLSYVADGDTYEVEEGVSLDSAALVDWYVKIVEASEGWIKVIVDAFRKEDLGAYDALHERLPEVQLVCDLGQRFEAAVKTKACSCLGYFSTAPSLAEQLERVGEKFLPAVFLHVATPAATSAATMDTLLAVPARYVYCEEPGELGTQLHELLADIR